MLFWNSAEVGNSPSPVSGYAVVLLHFFLDWWSAVSRYNARVASQLAVEILAELLRKALFEEDSHVANPSPGGLL